MKISFENAAAAGSRAVQAQRREEGVNRTAQAKSFSAYRTQLCQGNECIWEQDDHKGKNAKEVQQTAQNTDAAVMQDYMTVMSHTMSAEDYAQMEEEGFHFEQMDPETAVTIVDKIKAEMARSGQNVAGYTDDLDVDTLAAAVGSQALAQSIADSFAANDIPLTKENVEQCMQAVSMAEELHTPQNGQYRYMIDNEMGTDIWSFYMAQNSAGGQEVNAAPGYYAAEIPGYYTRAAQEGGEGLEGQIDQIIEQAGMEVNEETRSAAGWLLEQGLPLTGDNLLRYQEIAQINLPAEQEEVVKAASAAMAEGKEAYRGNLADSENIYQKAAGWLSYFEDLNLSQIENLTARRQLEEIRLRMTAEVNVKLLESGFSIDTAPMEELIQALKEAERQVAERYFPQDDSCVAKYQQYSRTCEVVQELPGLPAAVLGSFSSRIETGTLEEFHQEGITQKEIWQRAEESYEALGTAPRRDMGDSIRKAFANVDEILKDLGLETTEWNQRAVRILGYNRMSINQENIELVQEADSRVQKLIAKMTPAATLQMIRDGINPLEQSLEELNRYFDEMPQDYEESAESYSRFLYGLEQNQEITEQERSAYIGVYRLLHQVESSDGAAIGAVVNMQAQLNFSNLLSAVRTSKGRHLDVEISDQLGGLTELVKKGVSITEQINQGYGDTWKAVLTEASNQEGVKENLIKQNLEQVRQAAISDEDCIAMLQKGDVPVNAGNLLAAQALMGEPGALLGRWAERLGTDKTAKRLWEKLDQKEAFQEEYDQLTEENLEKTEALTMEMEASVDVKELQMLHKQLHITGALARQQEYVIPVELDGNTTYVHLTLEQGQDEKGQVRISMELEETGYVEGQLQVKAGRVNGYFAGNTPEAVTKLEQAADIFTNSVAGEWEMGSLQIVQGTLKRETAGSSSRQTSNEELYRLAKHFLCAMSGVE